MTRRRRLSLLVAVLFAGLLASCSNGNPDRSPTLSAPSDAAALPETLQTAFDVMLRQSNSTHVGRVQVSRLPPDGFQVQAAVFGRDGWASWRATVPDSGEPSVELDTDASKALRRPYAPAELGALGIGEHVDLITAVADECGQGGSVAWTSLPAGKVAREVRCPAKPDAHPVVVGDVNVGSDVEPRGTSAQRTLLDALTRAVPPGSHVWGLDVPGPHNEPLTGGLNVYTDHVGDKSYGCPATISWATDGVFRRTHRRLDARCTDVSGPQKLPPGGQAFELSDVTESVLDVGHDRAEQDKLTDRLMHTSIRKEQDGFVYQFAVAED